MLAEYVFVCNRPAGSFPERYRVLREGERPDELPDLDQLSGTVSAAGADGLVEALSARYPHLDVERTYANSWAAVQRSYVGLDYEHD